tara:strand:- start:13 stop:147 length:135 start_codon:yes stop_codon:yes gene_type:complete
VAELVDAVDLKSIACNGVRVQLPPSAPKNSGKFDKHSKSGYVEA